MLFIKKKGLELIALKINLDKQLHNVSDIAANYR